MTDCPIVDEATASGAALPEAGPDDRITRTALAVLDRVRTELNGGPFDILITDEHARVIEHADHELRIPEAVRVAMIVAPYHRTAAMRTLPEFAVAVAHVPDPRSLRTACIVALVCRLDAASELMLSYVRRIRREIEDGLVEDAAATERALTAHFVRARRHVRGAIVSLNERTMMTNAAAARLVGDADKPTLWEWARVAVERGETRAAELALSRGTVVVRCEPVTEAGETIGALVRLDERSHPSPSRSRRGGKRPRRPTFGWGSLSAAQLGIAQLVTDGLTNGEIAARLYLSPHTVDFHLRQIFSKLGIDSRVELARIVSDRAVDRSEAS